MNPILMLVFVVFFYAAIRDLFSIVFDSGMQSGAIHRQRKRQLRFSETQAMDDDEKVKSLIENITGPIIEYLIPNLRIRNLDEIERDLYLSKWIEYLSPIQYVAIDIAFKIIGVLVFVLLIKNAAFFAIVIGLLLFFGLPFFMRNSINERQNKLLVEFPDFIRMVDVYLSSGRTYSDSLLLTIEFLGEEWQDILRKMIAVAVEGKEKESLDVLLREFDKVEVREFVSITKLSFDQGGNLSEAFRSQADRVKELYVDAKEMQIERRKMWGTIMQLPILVAIMLAFGLPIVGAMMNFTGM